MEEKRKEESLIIETESQFLQHLGMKIANLIKASLVSDGEVPFLVERAKITIDHPYDPRTGDHLPRLIARSKVTVRKPLTLNQRLIGEGSKVISVCLCPSVSQEGRTVVEFLDLEDGAYKIYDEVHDNSECLIFLRLRFPLNSEP
ncbi:MAG: hypothetical protein JST85_00135 [Acidobacteria bacterium]|nr:hypothetical protein [Acidobacteriota bacterium]